jgi:hypothetical protein
MSVIELRRQSHFMPDAIDNAINRFEHIGVPESEYAIAVTVQRFRPRFIVLNGVAVLATIEFDHELGIVAGEVGDVSRERNLAAEVAAVVLQ